MGIDKRGLREVREEKETRADYPNFFFIYIFYLIIIIIIILTFKF